MGVTLLELLVGQVQTDGISDLLDEPEEIFADARDRRPEFSEAHLLAVEALARLAAECTLSVKRRIPSMTAVMRRAMEADQVSPAACEVAAPRAEVERGAAELQQSRVEMEAVEAQRRGAQRSCLVCFDEHAAGMECPVGHFPCSADAAAHVAAVIERATSDDALLQQYRGRGGRIKFVSPSCTHCYTDASLASALPDEGFHMYRAAQDQAVEHRIFLDLQQRFQSQLAEGLAEAAVVQAEREEASTAEFSRRQYPNAAMCPRCRHGPVLMEGCFDLRAHHGDVRAGGGRISNACPQCGFLAHDRNQWLPWVGELR